MELFRARCLIYNAIITLKDEGFSKDSILKNLAMTDDEYEDIINE